MKKSINSFLWHHIKPFKWYYLLMLQAPILNSFYPIIYNYILKSIIDILQTNINDLRAIAVPIIMFTITEFFLNIIWRLSDIAEMIAEPKVRRSIILESYQYIQNHSYSFFQNNLSGSISSKLKSIMDGYDQIWAQLHHGVSKNVLNSLVGIISLFLINIKLGINVTIIILIFIAFVIISSQKLKKLAFNEEESRHYLFGNISDKLTNIFNIFSFNRKSYEYQRLRDQINNDFLPKQIKSYKYYFIIELSAGLIFLVLYIYMFIYVCYLKIIGTISIGSIAFVLATISMISYDLWNFMLILPDFLKNVGEFKNSLSILNIKHQNKDVEDAKDLQIDEGIIRFENIDFSYDKNIDVFKNFTLEIKASEKIGIVGYSGAGKSTLIKLLLRYFNIQKGAIYIDNQDISKIKQDSLRENITLIPQDTLLFHRTLFENITYGKLSATKEEVTEACEKANIHEFIMNLPKKYETLIGERGTKLSGGQRQRIAIARAVLKNTKIFILDEATSSLDSETEKYIQNSINLITKNMNKTVICIAHRLSTIKNMDRIIVLDHGKIIEEGSHDFLINKNSGYYKKLCTSQNLI